MNNPRNLMKRALASAAVLCAGALLSMPAYSAELHKLRMAVVPAAGNLPVYVANAKGYFKDEGLDFEMLLINSGPGAASAVVSKSADVGWGGILPTVAARAQGIPFKFIIGGYTEQKPTYADTVMLASIKSGINDIKDLKGKVVAVNNAGGVNDLQVRIKLKEADIPVDSVQILTVPFPQMQAALELGNADVVATVSPFSTSILQRKLGKVIASGYVKEADLTKPIPVAGVYATEEWIKGNADTVARLKRAIDKANQLIKSNPQEAKQILQKQMKLAPALIEALVLPPYDTGIDPAGVQAVMDAAYSVGILKEPMKAESVISTAGDKKAEDAK